MLGLEGIEEYSNSIALLGVDGMDDPELEGYVRRLPPLKRQKVLQKLTQPAAPSRGSRAEMEKHFAQLPEHIKQGLLRQELRLADTVIYSIKPVTSRTIKIFETQDDKETGIRNISNAKLPKNQAFLVSGVFILAASAADGTKDKILAADFKGLEYFPAIACGEFDLKANKKQIVPETSNLVFRTGNLHNVPLGYYKLANPRMIEDDVLIECTINLGTQEGIPANTYVQVALHGTITTP